MTAAVKDSWNQGVDLVNYAGHGAIDRLGSAGYLTSAGVTNLNASRIPVVIAITCVAGQFSVPGTDCLGEYLVRKDPGGAIAIVAPTGLSWDSEAMALNLRLATLLKANTLLGLGDMFRQGLADHILQDHPLMPPWIYNLFGDPASRYNIPQDSPVSVATISGSIKYYAGDTAVSGTLLTLAGDASQTVTGGADGSYRLTNMVAGGTYWVTPGKTNDSPAAKGVTSFDLALIQRHILNLTPLNSPYHLLAAEVNGSQTITSLDLALIQRLVLGLTNCFPAGLWRFVPADYIFPDASSPWSGPGSHGYTNLSGDLVQEDYVAIKLGDVNGSWTAPAEGASLALGSAALEQGRAAALAPEVLIQVGSLTAQPRERLRVQVGGSGFRQVTSAQFTLAWDPGVLRYAGIGSYGLRGLSTESFGPMWVNEGKLTFAWYDPVATGVTVADGAAIFGVDFEVIGKPGSVSALVLGDSPTMREATANFAGVLVGTQDGSVRVVEPAGVRVSDATCREGLFHLSVPTVVVQRYILEFTDSLPGTHWTALPGVEGDGTVKILTDPGATNRQRFYRVRIE